MVAMSCAAGSSVPADYIRTSGLNPCTKQGHDVCGTCGMRMRAGVTAPCDWWWTQRLRAELSCRGTLFWTLPLSFNGGRNGEVPQTFIYFIINVERQNPTLQVEIIKIVFMARATVSVCEIVCLYR